MQKIDKILNFFLEELETRDPTDPQCQNSWENGTARLITWHHNYHNNEIYLKKEIEKKFGNRSKELNFEKLRGPLVNNFGIGTIMHLEPIHYGEISRGHSKLRHVLNINFVTELVLVYSCCMFTIATEKRFVTLKIIDQKFEDR